MRLKNEKNEKEEKMNRKMKNVPQKVIIAVYVYLYVVYCHTERV